jgi:ketosteroid isomerase-like protein
MGSLDANKQVVLRQIEALNAGDLEALQRLLHSDFFDHGSKQSTDNERRPSGERPSAAGARSRLEPLDIIAEDDRVTVRARLDGDLSRQQIHIWRVLDGLIVEHWQSTTEKEVTR